MERSEEAQHKRLGTVITGAKKTGESNNNDVKLDNSKNKYV